MPCRSLTGTVIATLLPAILAACSEPSMPEPADGAFFFAENCAICHGASGRGDGPRASELAKAPPDLTLLSRRNGGTFPTAEALSTIYGDPDQSHLARVMPQFGPALANDLVPLEVDGVLTPTPRALAGLFAYLETIQR